MARPTKKEIWKKNIAYGVTKMSVAVVAKFGEAFAIGANDKQACEYADVDPSTLWRWEQKNPELRKYFERMKQKLPLKAKANIAQAIHANNLTFSQWLVERQEPDDYAETFKMQHFDETKGDTPHKEDIEATELFHKTIKENMRKRRMEKAKQDGEIKKDDI